MSLFDESQLVNKIICGIDEVGRGPLAGPVVASAVILPEGFFLPEIKDSKKLNSKKISELAQLIKSVAVSYSLGFRDNKFIDDTDILTATFYSMADAVNSLSVKPDIVLIDGNQENPFIKNIPQKAVIKGDSKVIAISAASIIAKDFRDKLMIEYSKKYPQYGFEKNMGYGTKYHRDAIKRYGICEIHRKSFLKDLLIEENRLFE